MVDKEFCIDAKGFIQGVLVGVDILRSNGSQGNVTHGKESELCQAVCYASPNPPEICQGHVIPKQSPIRCFIQFRYPDAIFVSGNVLRHDVHGYLRQVHIRAYTHSGCYPCFVKNLSDHRNGEFMRCHVVEVQIGRHVHEDFINAIDQNVFWGDKALVDRVYPGAVYLIGLHARWGNNGGQLIRGLICQNWSLK